MGDLINLKIVSWLGATCNLSSLLFFFDDDDPAFCYSIYEIHEHHARKYFQ